MSVTHTSLPLCRPLDTSAGHIEMSLNDFRRDNVLGSNSTYRITDTPFWAVAAAGQAVNLTIPGTGPYKVHSSLYDARLNTQLSYWQHLPGNLTRKYFIWTPQLEEGSRNSPITEGDETNFRPKYENGDSVIWAFTEMQDGWHTPGVESDVYVGGNFTILTQEEADKQDPNYREHADMENGVIASKSSLIRVVLAGLFVSSAFF